ncbi:MAG: zinc-ribbon domain-containing protein, partial [Actinobacteria bacterium]|nr:zinc-ribbon domain-containing protein [Actinomycetota bacterium]
MYCTRCGNKLAPADKYCSRCGKSINMQKLPAKQKTVPATAQKKSLKPGLCKTSIKNTFSKIYKNFLLDPSSINMVCDGIICLKLVTHLPERI